MISINLDEEIEVIDEIREYLKINKNELDTHIAQNPELFYLVSEKSTEFNALKESTKHDLELLEARLSYEYRRDASERATDKRTKEYCEQHPKYILKRKEFLRIRYISECWDALKGAFQQRGFMLRDLAQLYVAGFFSDSSIKESVETNVVQYEEARKKLAAKRKSFVKQMSGEKPTLKTAPKKV